MKNTPKITFAIFLLILTVNINYGQICSDNICETGETSENCPRDCWLDTITLFIEEGGRVDWAHDGSDLIAFDSKDSTGFYDVYTINPDGTGRTCITCDAPGLPQNHNGQPAWHPFGEWLVFQAENEHEDSTVNSGGSTPGKGGRSNLWVYSDIQEEFYQLTFLPDSDSCGVLHPHFSHDGTKLSWSEKYNTGGVIPFGQSFGVWMLKTADFVVDGDGYPSLQNITEHQPFDEVFYENHSFTPDDSGLLFSSNINLWTLPLNSNQMVVLDLASGNTIQLTDSTYNEHAQYTPDGQKILWGTNRQNPEKGMDYWIMNTDGSNKQRITYFNDSTQYEYIPGKAYAIDMSFSADGMKMISYVQNDLIVQEGAIYMYSFKDCATINEHILKDYEPVIYPNPAYGTIRIEGLKNSGIVDIHICDLSGKVLKSFIYNANDEIDISDLSTGFYIIRIEQDKMICFDKFLKM